jgi:hypothetical protein
MPYTRHGHWYGADDPTTPPDAVARCGGPAVCPDCALDAHRGEEGAPVQPLISNPNQGVSYLTTTQGKPGITATYTPITPPPEPDPTVGRQVHYVSYGTPGGEFRSECRAATVTEVDPADPGLVGLAAINPTGVFFHPLATGGCHRHNGYETTAAGVPPRGYPGGTWHWPERV